MEDISAQQQTWLQQLQSLSKRLIRVSKNIQGRPSAWGFIEDTQFPVDYRTVLHNEVVIDIDSTRWKEVRLFSEMIIDVLNRMHVPFIPAYTGGRGVHIHFFFSLSEKQKQRCNQHDVMPQDLRMVLFEKIMKEADISHKVIRPGKPLDTSCINWSDGGKGHLIRIFGGKKQRHKTMLQEIPEERPHTKDIAFPEKIIPWNISDDLFEEFLESFKISHKKRVEATARYRAAAQNFSGTYLKLPCIQEIMKGLSEGQRNKGAQILSLVCKIDDIPRDEAQKTLLKYAHNCSSENISEKEYLSWVDWIYSQKETFWNCRFCKELDICKEETCGLHESAYQKEHEFLEDENLLPNILNILDKRIKKEEKNKLIVFLVYLSAYGSNPLNMFLKGESSIGKTYLAKSVAEYFPEEDVLFIGDMSPKALIHEHGEVKEGKVYVSLENKILVFLESPRRQTLDMLKPILSHDRKEIEYKIADKSGSGKLQTKSVIITGWPATTYCTTDCKVLEELSTRSLLATPEITEEKISQVLTYKGKKYSRPWEEMEEDEQEQILTNSLNLLKEDIEVCVPYAGVLAEQYEKGEPRVMRDFDKLMELIRMSAFLHQRQRMHFENNGGNRFIIATEYDYWVGKLLFDAIRETTCTGIPQPVIDFYEDIITQIQGIINYQSLREHYVSIHKRPISTTHLRNRFIEPLESVGWLIRELDPVDGRRVIFKECRIDPENSQTIGEYEALYFKHIFPEEKLKKYIKRLEKIQNKNTKNTMQLTFREKMDNEKNWFYTKKVLYFLMDNNWRKTGTNDDNAMKYESFINPYNLEETKEKNGISCNELIDQYDEETVLLQIPQEDTKIEDVVKKFEDPNKVVDAFVVLQEKEKIVAGQGLIRKLSHYPQKKDPDMDKFDLNTWTCGICGVSFQAQNPYRDYDDYAICEKCWKKLTKKENP